jgi:hypothetical protein
MIQQAMRRARATGNAGSRICRSSSVNATRGSATRSGARRRGAGSDDDAGGWPPAAA